MHRQKTCNHSCFHHISIVKTSKNTLDSNHATLTIMAVGADSLDHEGGARKIRRAGFSPTQCPSTHRWPAEPRRVPSSWLIVPRYPQSCVVIPWKRGSSAPTRMDSGRRPAPGAAALADSTQRRYECQQALTRQGLSDSDVSEVRLENRTNGRNGVRLLASHFQAPCRPGFGR